ncbi:MAG: hypothetical protein HC881_04445 [Leptolyngbyaceae cyanobacterium SL_7_1]|nr:hypothetical protein [Leptolyngbyaceae cyanobacterium SL_7_1]
MKMSKDFLYEIVHCSHAKVCREDSTITNPCREIVDYQTSIGLDAFQAPEPWSGNIEYAPILFLSSNPSISSNEIYPTWDWSSEEIYDYFNYRFGGGNKDWSINGTKPLLINNKYGRSVQFWAAVRQRAIELFQRDVFPGTDYALTEIVHCKSRNEIGVEQAQYQCVEAYLLKILELAGAKVIVVLGARAKQAVQDKFNISSEVTVSEPINIGGHEKLFTFLPHPNARGYRSFAKCLQNGELEMLRCFLR